MQKFAVKQEMLPGW